MADRFHAHDMSGWSIWYYAGNNTDERFRACKDTRACGYSETQGRRHQHDA